MTFATGVAPDRAAALALARKYRDGSAAARAFSMAFTHVHITLQHLGLSDEHAMLFDRLASRVFGSDASRISPADLAGNTLGQQNLWGYGISGRPADRAPPRRRTRSRCRSHDTCSTHRSTGASKGCGLTSSS